MIRAWDPFTQRPSERADRTSYAVGVAIRIEIGIRSESNNVELEFWLGRIRMASEQQSTEAGIWKRFKIGSKSETWCNLASEGQAEKVNNSTASEAGSG